LHIGEPSVYKEASPNEIYDHSSFELVVIKGFLNLKNKLSFEFLDHTGLYKDPDDDDVL
jgi:hypothetical protein